MTATERPNTTDYFEPAPGPPRFFIPADMRCVVCGIETGNARLQDRTKPPRTVYCRRHDPKREAQP